MGLVGPHATIRGLFTWLFIVSCAVKKIELLASQFRELDYEVLDLSTADALSRFKDYRARVSGLRKSLEMCHRVKNGPQTSDVYEVLRNAGVTPAKTGTIDETPAPTPRQLASSSVEDEHRWIDQEAASIVPMLEQSVKLIELQHSIEQIEQRVADQAAANRISEQFVELSQRSAELADTMKNDLAVIIKSSERSTVLIILGAVYLLLIMAATRSSNSDFGPTHGPSRWSVVLAGLGLVCSTLLSVLVFFTRKRVVQHLWEHKLHRLSGDWWEFVEEKKGEKEA